MKLKQDGLNFNFWLLMTLVVVLIWYLMCTPHGAVRRELVGKQWLGAIGAKIEVVNPNARNVRPIYTTNPRLKDDEGRTFYFTCNKKNIFLKCQKINY